MVGLSANRLLQTRIAFWRLLIADRIFRVCVRFRRNRCVFERLVGVCVECACVVSSTSRRRGRCVLAESKYASGAVAEGGRQLMLGVIAGDVGGVCSSFRHGCAYFGVLACFTRNKRTQNTRILDVMSLKCAI